MSRRFWVGLMLSLPAFLIAMTGMLPGSPLHHLDMQALNWLQLALTAPVVLWCGWPFFVRAWRSVVNRSPNMFTLIALGVGAAFLYSVAATVAPGAFPEGFRTLAGAVEPYFDTAAVVTVLVLLGQVLELRARRRPLAPFAACSARLRRPPASSAPTAARKTSRWTASSPAICYVCGPARKSPWTVPSSRVAAPWTSRC